MSEEKKINDQQESGSPEQLSLNDDRRVKIGRSFPRARWSPSAFSATASRSWV